MRIAGPSDGAFGRTLIEQVERIATRTADHFLSICIRALDYCPPAAIVFSDYLRALVTADRVLSPVDAYGYREDFIDAFRRRGMYPADIDMVSELELCWGAPEVATYPIPGLGLAELRYEVSPTLPMSQAEYPAAGAGAGPRDRRGPATLPRAWPARPGDRRAEGADSRARR